MESVTEESLKDKIRALQEEMAKSDFIIAELNITIEDLKEYNTRLENDIQSKDAVRTEEAKQLDLEQSDEWLNLEIEVARLQKEVNERDSIIRTQKEALDKTLSKGGSLRHSSLAGAARQALDINVSEMAKKYNEALVLCKNTSAAESSGERSDREMYEMRLQDLERKNYQFVEELGVRHTEEMERLRSDYEVLLELAVKEKENEMRNTIIEDEELEDLAAQVDDLTQSLTEKEKLIRRQEDTISDLTEQLHLLTEKQKSVPMALPKIVIEDPDGEVQCEECSKKADKLKELTQTYQKTQSDYVEYQTQARNSLSATDSTIRDIRAVHCGVQNDLREMRNELASFSSDITSAISCSAEAQKKTLSDTASQTDAPTKQRVLPQPASRGPDSPRHEATSDTMPRHEVAESSKQGKEMETQTYSQTEDENSAGFKEKETRYKKDIFDLKVKLKELEVKMDLIKKRADEMKLENDNEIVSDNLSNNKLLELVRNKEQTLQQARRLHGANVATMRKRHDKVVASLQATIDQLTVTLQQFVPGYNTPDIGTADRIQVTCRQGRFNSCTVITDNLNGHR